MGKGLEALEERKGRKLLISDRMFYKKLSKIETFYGFTSGQISTTCEFRYRMSLMWDLLRNKWFGIMTTLSWRRKFASMCPGIKLDD